MDLSKSKLPPIYKRNGRECYLDPIRQKLIYITPEETVRQKVISYIVNDLKVPIEMIRVEEHLSHYGIRSKERADIIIVKYNADTKEINPLVVIECKAPDVYLSEGVGRQMTGYADALNCDYCMMTNGTEAFCYYYAEDKKDYVLIENIPDYISMVRGDFVECPLEKHPPRLKFDEIPGHCREYDGYDIGSNTPNELAEVCVNLWEALLYPGHKLPVKEYKIFRLIEDYGIRLLSYGNASGGSYFGAYRSFLVNYNGSTEFVSIGLSPYSTWSKQDIAKTAINVAIDTDDDAHHSLQLCVDDNVVRNGKKVTFYHSGRIGFSNKGSGKIEGLRIFTEDLYPSIIDGKRFNLGTLTYDRLWEVDDPEFMNLIENLISYALVRDEYRKYLRKQK